MEYVTSNIMLRLKKLKFIYFVKETKLDLSKFIDNAAADEYIY